MSGPLNNTNSNSSSSDFWRFSNRALNPFRLHSSLSSSSSSHRAPDPFRNYSSSLFRSDSSSNQNLMFNDEVSSSLSSSSSSNRSQFENLMFSGELVYDSDIETSFSSSSSSSSNALQTVDAMFSNGQPTYDSDDDEVSSSSSSFFSSSSSQAVQENLRTAFPKFDFESNISAQSSTSKKRKDHPTSDPRISESSGTDVYPVSRKKGSLNLFHSLQARSLGAGNAAIGQYLETRRKYGKIDPKRGLTFNNGMLRIPPIDLGITNCRATIGKTHAFFHNSRGEIICLDMKKGVRVWGYSVPAHSNIIELRQVFEISPNRLVVAGRAETPPNQVQIIGFDDLGPYVIRGSGLSGSVAATLRAVGNTFFVCDPEDKFTHLNDEFNVMNTYKLSGRITTGRLNFLSFGEEFVAHTERDIIILNQDPAVKPEKYSVHDNKHTKITAIYVDQLRILCGLKRNYTAPAALCMIHRKPTEYHESAAPEGDNSSTQPLTGSSNEREYRLKFFNASQAFSLEKNPQFIAELKKKRRNKAKYKDLLDQNRTLIVGQTTSIGVYRNMAYLGDSTGIVASVDLSEDDSSTCLFRHKEEVNFLSISKQIMATADNQLIALSDLTKNVFYKAIPVWNHAPETFDWSMKSCTLFDNALMATMTNRAQSYLAIWKFKTLEPDFQQEQEDFQQGANIASAKSNL